MSNKKKKKFVIKAQDKVRKDEGKVGLIISEKRDTVDHETFIGDDLEDSVYGFTATEDGPFPVH